MTNKRITDETLRTPIDGTEQVRLATTGANWRAPLSTIFSTLGGSGGDPLTLTKGFTLNALDPTVSGNTSFSYGGRFNVTYDTLIDDIGFTDQQALSVNLQFNAGYNQFTGGGGLNIDGKYTPIALAVGGTYYGAGEKFGQSWNTTMYSMGDCFLWSAAHIYVGGPIAGDEGQGFTPATFCNQPNNLFIDTITAVHRTTYSSTVTVAVAGSTTAQAINVATTTGATVGDWVILHQEVMSASTRIWAMQITAISPGTPGTITGVCAINLIIGDTVTPALCLSLGGGGIGFGEGRVVVNNSGTSYSTGTVHNVGGSFVGTGTSWTNGMVGGDALNVGSFWLTVDNLTGSPFSPGIGNMCRSVYQIINVNSTTSINIFSFSVAADTAYHGRGETGTGLAYTIVPSARIMRTQNPGGGFDIICEHSAHAWNVGDSIECVFCPYPDLHGLDYRIGEFTAGGTRRQALGIQNDGARAMQAGIILLAQAGGGINSLPDYDVFAWDTGIQIFNAQIGIQISSTGTGASDAIQINATSDAGTVIRLENTNTITLGTNTTNSGADFQISGLLRSISSSVNIDTLRNQLVWDGYFQLSDVHVANPYMRFAGSNTAGASITNTCDLQFISGTTTFNWSINGASGLPNPWKMFSIGQGGNSAGTGSGASIGESGLSTSNTTNQPSIPLQLCANVWTGTVAQRQYAALQAVPGSGVSNAPISLQCQIWNNTYNNVAEFNIPLEVFMGGLVKLGFDDPNGVGDHRVTLDAVANLTAARTVTFPNATGDLLVAQTNTTGAGSALLGGNSPATTNTAPYTWMKMLSHDGSTVYVPAWK